MDSPNRAAATRVAGRVPVALFALALACAVTGCRLRRAPPARERPSCPPTHVEMTVAAVAPAGDGKAVLLADPAGQIVVPIFVGGTEGLSIELRQEKRRYQRPLTHDLLDSVMRELGGELDKVQVDDLKSNVFIGTVFVRQGTRVVPIDARPSDAIALALGADAPIFVARKVVEAAGVRRDQLDGSGEPGRPRVPAGEPESL